MRLRTIDVCLSLAMSLGTAAFADDYRDRAEVKTNEMKRDTVKTGHRVEESLCIKSDAECATRKAKHRVTETKDLVSDKVDEAKDRAVRAERK